VHVYKKSYTHTYTHTRTHTQKHAHTHIHTHTHTHIHTHTPTHTLTLTRTHTIYQGIVMINYSREAVRAYKKNFEVRMYVYISFTYGGMCLCIQVGNCIQIGE